jgi:hypothetical protein
MSEAKRGDKNPNKNGLSEDHKEKIRISNKGWKHSNRTINKLKILQKGPRPYRIKKYLLISPEGKKYIIESRKKLLEFIANKKLSQRKILSNINNGPLSEENFVFLKGSSKKTLGWEIRKF